MSQWRWCAIMVPRLTSDCYAHREKDQWKETSGLYGCLLLFYSKLCRLSSRPFTSMAHLCLLSMFSVIPLWIVAPTTISTQRKLLGATFRHMEKISSRTRQADFQMAAWLWTSLVSVLSYNRLNLSHSNASTKLTHYSARCFSDFDFWKVFSCWMVQSNMQGSPWFLRFWSQMRTFPMELTLDLEELESWWKPTKAMYTSLTTFEFFP